MAFSLVSSSATIFVAYLLWKLFYPYFTTLSIDQLPGPAPQSLWLGMFRLILLVLVPHSPLLGNLPTYGDRQGWRTWAQSAETYGSIFLIKVFLGVCFITFFVSSISSLTSRLAFYRDGCSLSMIRRRCITLCSKTRNSFQSV